MFSGFHADLEYAASAEASSKIGAKGMTSASTVEDSGNGHLLVQVAATRYNG
jgi:hypothetical protein